MHTWNDAWNKITIVLTITPLFALSMKARCFSSFRGCGSLTNNPGTGITLGMNGLRGSITESRLAMTTCLLKVSRAGAKAEKKMIFQFAAKNWIFCKFSLLKLFNLSKFPLRTKLLWELNQNLLTSIPLVFPLTLLAFSVTSASKSH